MCNVATNAATLARRVADEYLKALLEPLPRPAINESEVPLSAEQLARFVGLYWSDQERHAVRFFVEDGRLIERDEDNDTWPLKSVGGGRFLPASGAGVRYEFDVTSSNAQRVTMTGPAGLVTTFERTEPFAPTPTQLVEFAGSYTSNEIDPVFRIVIHGDMLQLERFKASPDAFAPVIKTRFMENEERCVLLAIPAAASVASFWIRATF